MYFPRLSFFNIIKSNSILLCGMVLFFSLAIGENSHYINHASSSNKDGSPKAAYDQSEGLPEVRRFELPHPFNCKHRSSSFLRRCQYIDFSHSLYSAQYPIAMLSEKRLVKESAYYEKETKENEEQLQKMKDEQKDHYDIKKFEEVLAESQMMIPDSISRRDKALDDLREFVSVLEKDEADNNELMTCEWMAEAKKLAPSEKNNANGGGDVEITAVDDLAEGEAF
jgi:tubulin-specific chaperone A